MIVLDTSVLSIAYRRRAHTPLHPAVEFLDAAIQEDLALGVPGIVLQELLTGIRHDAQRERLESLMEGFPLLLPERGQFLLGARIANRCRSAGIATTAVDCLIAAQTIIAGGRLLTLDDDFLRIATRSELRLVDGVVP